MARSRKPFKLGLDPAAYNPTGLKSYDRRELEHEYSRLRREAWDRLRKLGQSEFSWTKTYRENKDKFKPIKEIQSDRELRALLTDAARFVMSKTSSASGMRDQRRKQVASLHRNGLTWITPKNHRWCSEWAESLKEKKYDRDTLYELLKATTEQEEPDKKERKQQSEELEEHFKRWLQQEHPEEYDNLYPDEPEPEDDEPEPEPEDDEPEPEPRPRSRSRRKKKKAAPKKRKYRSKG